MKSSDVKKKEKKKEKGFYLDRKLCTTRICRTFCELVVQLAAHELGRWAQKQNVNGPSIGCLEANRAGHELEKRAQKQRVLGPAICLRGPEGQVKTQEYV